MTFILYPKPNMEGIAKQIEGVDLNDFTTDELQDVVRGLSDEYKTLESNTERGVQGVIGEKKMMEKAIDSFKSVNNDPDKLNAIIQDDPELGKFIMEKFYDGKSIDDLKKNNPTITDDLIDERLNRKEVERKLDSVRDQIPEGLLKKFNEEFEEITEGKKLSSENMLKYVKNALSNISDDDSTINAIKFTAMGSGGKGGNSKKTEEQKGTDSVLAHLRNMGAIK